MKKRILVLIVLVFAAAAAFAQAKPRLAVLPFTGGNPDDAETIAELFSFEDEILRNFSIMPRTSGVEAIMKEQQFQQSGLTDSDTIAELGRQLNADYVLAGHIAALGDRKLILVTVIHVESLRQATGDYKEYQNIEEVQGILPGMARRITAASRLDTSGLPRLAVLPFNTLSGSESQQDAELLSRILAAEIANDGKYAVLIRTSAIQTVMAERNIQRSTLTETDSIVPVGNALNAQYVLSGNIRRLGQTSIFTASIINVESASQLTGAMGDYQTLADGLTLMAELGAKLAGAGNN
jgi:TolB-like protein